MFKSIKLKFLVILTIAFYSAQSFALSYAFILNPEEKSNWFSHTGWMVLGALVTAIVSLIFTSYKNSLEKEKLAFTCAVYIRQVLIFFIEEIDTFKKSIIRRKELYDDESKNLIDRVTGLAEDFSDLEDLVLDIKSEDIKNILYLFQEEDFIIRKIRWLSKNKIRHRDIISYTTTIQEITKFRFNIINIISLRSRFHKYKDILLLGYKDDGLLSEEILKKSAASIIKQLNSYLNIIECKKDQIESGFYFIQNTVFDKININKKLVEKIKIKCENF